MKMWQQSKGPLILLLLTIGFFWKLVRTGMVVLADTFYPGWGTTVDGAPAEVLEAYEALREIVVLQIRHKPRRPAELTNPVATGLTKEC